MEISKDERERARYRSRRMFETDQISNILTAEERGIDLGKKQGIEIGKEQGIEIGENKMALKIVQAMKAKNVPFEQIVEYTGLTLDQVKKA